VVVLLFSFTRDIMFCLCWLVCLSVSVITVEVVDDFFYEILEKVDPGTRNSSVDPMVICMCSCLQMCILCAPCQLHIFTWIHS